MMCHKKILCKNFTTTITDCQVCSYKLNYIALSKVHMDSAHSPGVTTTITNCQVCRYKLNHNALFKVHMDSAHSPEVAKFQFVLVLCIIDYLIYFISITNMNS